MSRLAAPLALAAVAALAAPAAARPDPFETYVANLAANPKAAASHLGGCALILLPSGEARTPCSLALADLVGAQTGVTLKATRFKYGDISMSTVQYIEADVEARVAGKVVATFHVLEVGGMGNPDAEWTPEAVHWARVISDKDAAARAKAGQLPAAPAIRNVAPPPPRNADDQDAADRDEGLREITSALTGNPELKGLIADTAGAGVVFGSGPGQRMSGKGGARSIQGWKLALAQHGGVTAAGNALVVFAATDIVGTPKDRTSITYAALVVGAMHMIPDSGDHVWETKMISFAVPQ